MYSNLLFLLALLLGTTTAASGQAVCPEPNDRARGMVVGFLTSPNTLDERQARGMGSARPENVRVLIDAQDAATCQWLRDTVQLGQGPYPRSATYYHADGFYFVATTWVVPPDRVFLGHSALLVFDAQRNFIGSYAR